MKTAQEGSSHVAPGDSDLAALLNAQLPNGAYPAASGFSQYDQCWLRDGSFIAHATDLAGQSGSAALFHGWVSRTLAAQADTVRTLISRRRAGEPISEFEFLPARYDVSGEWRRDGWPNFQLDGYGLWLWSLANHLRLTGQSELPTHFASGVGVAVEYLSEFWDEPCYDCWEEHRSQLHTSTLGSISAGMSAIAHWVPSAGAIGEAALDLVVSECVVDGRLVKYIGNPEVDASLAWLATPLDVIAAEDPVMQATIAKIERDLVDAGGTRRYRADTYYGGGEWIILSAFLAWHYGRVGRLKEARTFLDWIERQRLPDGSLPEQVPGKGNHARFLEHWTRTWGASASPLVWSHAMTLCARLAVSRAQGSRRSTFD